MLELEPKPGRGARDRHTRAARSRRGRPDVGAPRPSGAWTLALAIWLAGLGACRGDVRKLENAAPEVCKRAYTQCVIRPGVLGVCNEAPCAAGATPPCLACVSQH